MTTIRHWSRAGFQCDHVANSVKAALIECLRCRGLSLAGAALLNTALERTGEAKFVSGEQSFIFRVVRR